MVNRVYALPVSSNPPSEFYVHAVALYNALGSFVEIYDAAIANGKVQETDLEKPELAVYRGACAALDAAGTALPPAGDGSSPVAGSPPSDLDLAAREHDAAEASDDISSGPSREEEVAPDLDVHAE